MGVQGLWELLAPVGRRVSVETLAGKRVAIDASIWLVQFIKAMRDERGEMVHNAHLLGFFRRICKLLFLRTRPVFVFDGGTPALKRRTIAARRRQRENATAKIRKTAEKLLLNHLKARKLEELAAELKEGRCKEDLKGKSIASVARDELSLNRGSKGTEHNTHNGLTQEELDEMLAASIAAEEEELFISKEATPSVRPPLEDEFDEDEDEEMAIPIGNGRLDPTVLASLPPSMQLDLLVQMRERLMAENRQKYQKIKKSPSKFSELQIQSYLKTVAFRREIDEAQRNASGKGPEGLQTFRIASEANREYVFSSSFSGDKRNFTPSSSERPGNVVNTGLNAGNESLPEEIASGPSSSHLVSSAGANQDVSTEDFSQDIETYIDERGRTRVSRVRGLGIRMTRDLQRNLDLILENDKNQNNTADNGKTFNQPANQSSNDSSSDQSLGISVMKETSMEVSFSVDDADVGEDEIFSGLVSGKSTVQLPSKSHPVGKESNNNDSDSPSDVDWEDGQVDLKFKSNDGLDTEDGAKFVSTSLREEEAEIQMAIEKSLEDLKRKSQVHESSSERKDANSSSFSLETNEILQTNSPKSECPPKVNDGLDMEDGAKSVSTGLQEQESEILVVIEKSLDNFNWKSQVYESSSERNAFNSSSLSLETNEVLRTSSPKSESPPNTTEMRDPFRDVEISETVIFSQSNNCDDGNASTSLMGEGEFQQKSCGNIRHKDEENVVVSLPEGSDICEKAIGKELDEKHEALKPEEFTLSSKEEHKYSSSPYQNEISRAEGLESALDEELSHINRECRDLGDEQRRLERNAESVNSEMFSECQDLLQMFGLPFIIAPMEAEAQCAYMEMTNLVDGIVTDDSDAFLFGAQRVFKNIFDERKYVETYLMKDIENELGLTREQLIRMALLLGSDYTEGVSGIGIVNAIEVVHAFPEEDGLKEFREWVESPDPSLFEKLRPHIGNKVGRRSSKSNNGDADEYASDPDDDLPETKRTFMERHRNVSKNWHIPPSFPSAAVTSAYINPQVDGSTEPFSWGKPDLPLLRRLCWEKFGWAQQKADELLVPVLKEYNKHETQLRLEAFYTFNERFAKIRSKRIKKAVKGITGKNSEELVEGEKEEGESMEKKKKQRATASEYEPKRRRSDVGPIRGGRRKSAEEVGGQSDESDGSPQVDLPAEVASASSGLRRSTRQRRSSGGPVIQGPAEVNSPKEESQPSPSLLSGGQGKVNDTALVKEDSQLLQGQHIGGEVDSDDGVMTEHLLGGGGFCPGQDEEEKEEEEDEIGEVKRAEEVFKFTPMPSLRRKRR
ncbi:5'-3' exonuclease family protein [Wolffia australiana]